jgi:hypothetical protein
MLEECSFSYCAKLKWVGEPLYCKNIEYYGRIFNQLQAIKYICYFISGLRKIIRNKLCLRHPRPLADWSRLATPDHGDHSGGE